MKEEQTFARNSSPWQQKLKFTYVTISAFLLACTGSSIFALLYRPIENYSVVGLFAGSAVLLSGLVFMTLRLGGVAWIGRSRRIKPIHGRDGGGVAVPGQWAIYLVLWMIALSCAVIGFSVWYAQSNGQGATVATPSRDSAAGAGFMLAVGVVGLAGMTTLLLLRPINQTHVSTDGIRRIDGKGLIRRRRDVLIPWTALSKVVPTEELVDTRYVTVRHQLVELHHPGFTHDERVRLDTEHQTILRLSQLVAEPNTLFALIDDMHRHPDRRALLSGPDATALLTPPPLRERWRAARELRQSSGKQ
ncbi:hypothetical protein [Rhodococcus sp. HNM0569]|uniref:hypothetical protein n=1 Tax=Rhodococcus sp. HNM0569 TaxID=2716340 RepID=UPI00146EAD62|nr:hypothetical protein [Rhodococcus sp. HNM0569]NLU82721.1 hypothetical protein [Rhodococcus sp. HNM0569]